MTEPETCIRVQRIRAHQGLLLRELRLESLANSPEAFGQPIEEARGQPEAEWHRAARQSSHGDNRTWLFAYERAKTIGLVHGRKRRPNTLLLFSMWIEASARRKGLGRRLIDELEDWARHWQAHRTILWVYQTNHSAIRFYRDLGFEVIGDGKDAEAGARFDALAMQRVIEWRTR